jgi:lysylphosphatidylglycerol synthetase-like protein (DUF2156 family)
MTTLDGHVLEQEAFHAQVYIIIVTMLPKFFYSHTWNNHVLQWFLGFIIVKTSIKFHHYNLRISVGFIHNGILLLQSIWRIMWRRVVLGGDNGEETRVGE